jgi:NAD(P)-dependent dehydrogenase (short-subunit alcohol dehydrogenase family)
MGRFTGKRVLITGGTNGIGLAGAKLIAAEGGQLVLTGTNPQRIADIQQALPAARVLGNDASDPRPSGVRSRSWAVPAGIFPATETARWR